MKSAIVILLVALLSGCTTPDEEAPDLLGACPQWVPGPEYETAVTSNGTAQILIEANVSVPSHHQGYPLDMYLLRMSSDDPVEVRAHVDPEQRMQFHIQDGEDVETRPFITLQEEREVQVFLSPVAHGADPAPSSLRLDVAGPGGVQVHATPFYRVCGVLLATPGT